MRKFIPFLVVILVLTVLPRTSPVLASPENQWQADQRVPGYLDDTFTPYIIADENKTVHAFASQRLSDFSADRAIIYRQWTLASGWTLPVDIIALPQGDTQIQGAFLDKSGTMHIIFWGGSPRDAHIYYSHVFAADAGRGPAWSRPVIIGDKAGGTASAYLTGDGDGNLVVIYNGQRDGNGVYATVSKNHGESWTKAQSIFLTYDNNLSGFSLRLFERKGQVRATWSVVTSRGGDVSLHFANYDIEKAEWSETILLNAKVDIGDIGSFGPSFPSMVDNGEEIIIMYNNGNPFKGRPVNLGRPVQMVSTSNTNGDFWNVPIVPFISHVGRSGEHTVVLDSQDIAHAFFVQRVESNVGGKYQIVSGVFHSAYVNGLWSDPDRFVTSYPPHDVRAVVSQGNVMLVVWRQDPGAQKLHGIWFTFRILDAPELPAVPLPTSVIGESDTNTTPDLGVVIPTLIPPTPIPSDVNLDRPLLLGANPASGMAVSVFFVVVLLVVVIYIYSSNWNSKNR